MLGEDRPDEEGPLSALFDLPAWLHCSITVLAFSVFSVVGLLLMRPRSRRLATGVHAHNEFVNYFIASIGVFYGLTLGLVAVAALQNYSAAGDRTATESAALAALWRDCSSFPAGERELLQASLRDYARYVVSDAWSLQRQGIVPVKGVEILNEFQRRLLVFEPRSDRERILFAEALRQYNHFIELRRLRLHAVAGGMPVMVWAVLIAGAVITIASTWFVVIDNLTTHAVLTAMFAAMLGLLIFLTAALDNPFRGSLGIDAGAFQWVLEYVMK